MAAASRWCQKETSIVKRGCNKCNPHLPSHPSSPQPPLSLKEHFIIKTGGVSAGANRACSVKKSALRAIFGRLWFSPIRHINGSSFLYVWTSSYIICADRFFTPCLCGGRYWEARLVSSNTPSVFKVHTGPYGPHSRGCWWNYSHRALWITQILVSTTEIRGNVSKALCSGFKSQSSRECQKPPSFLTRSLFPLLSLQRLPLSLFHILSLTHTHYIHTAQCDKQRHPLQREAKNLWHFRGNNMNSSSTSRFRPTI